MNFNINGYLVTPDNAYVCINGGGWGGTQDTHTPPEYVHDFLGKIADKYNLLLKKHLNKDNKTI